jgi:HPt (histidine-containing phosphotransfer) domain-containing protein
MEAQEKSYPTPKLNLDELLVRVDGDGELLRELLSLFKQKLPKYFDDLQEAVAHGDIAQVTFLSHTLKGVLLNLAAAEAADSASRLEQLACHGDRASFKAAFAALEHDIESLLPEIDRHMAQARP